MRSPFSNQFGGGSRPSLPGERALLVFISSVIDDETNWAREAVTQTLEGVPFLQPWAFEFTPAVSQGAVDSYMEKVQDCDVFVWLVANNTTPPVEQEVRKALTLDKRIWVFRLSTENVSDQTQGVLDLIGERAKWVTVQDQKELQQKLQLTLQDEIVRALKLRPALGRASRLASVDRASRARCVAGWQAAGVPHETAQLLALDSAIGRPGEHLLPTTLQPLVVLIGDFGAGKSLLAERFHQQAIEDALADPNAPVPVWLSGDSIGQLNEDVLAAGSGIGDPRRVGAVVVIDRVDEVGAGKASRLLSDGRVLVHAWPNTKIMLSSRSGQVANPEERRMMPLLTEAAALSIIGRFSGTGVTSVHAHGWPPSIRDAIKRPLFALVLAKSLSGHHSLNARTPAELIAYLVEQSLGRARVDELASHRVFMEAARRIIDADAGGLDSRELGRGPEIRNALDSGLLVEEEERLRFTLPIILEWFAALSLASEQPNAAVLAADPERLEKWRHPLGVLIASNDHATVLKTLGPIARANPAFASLVVQDAVGGFQLGEREVSVLPSALECGARIRACMEHWTAGFGNLAKRLRAVTPQGDLRPLGVGLSNRVLMTSWYGGERDRDPVSILPSRFPGELFEDRWLNLKSAVPPPTPAWAWHWTKDEIAHELEKWVRDRSFSLETGPASLEEAWTSALALSGRGSLHPGPIPLADLESKLAVHHEAEVVHSMRGQIVIQPLLRHVKHLLSIGELEFRSPWPPADVERPKSNWVWALYSEERFLARTRAIYGAALEIYAQIVNQWFESFIPRLGLMAMLPVRLVGSISRFDPSSAFDPVLEWYLDPLPHDEENQVVISSSGPLSPSNYLIDPDFRAQLDARLTEVRPGVSRWLSVRAHADALEIYGTAPATDLAYSWIWHDLYEVGWVRSRLVPPRRR